MSHILFLESNTTGTGRLAVERLLEQGNRVTFLANRLTRYPFLSRQRPHLECREVDTNDPAVVARESQAIHAAAPIDALVTFSEFYVEGAAQAARRLSLPFLSPQAAARCRNKFQTRRTLRAAGLPTPEFHLVTNEAETVAVSRAMTYPCVVKPPADSSSSGVRRVENAGQLLQQCRQVASWKTNARGQQLDGSVLVESLLEGPEYSVETFTLRDGSTRIIGVTDKHLSSPPYFVELGHDFPSRRDEATRRRLEAIAVAALDAVGFDLGPAHIEMRDTVEGPVVVEINPRLAGGLIPELILHALGIDLLAAWFDLLLDRPVHLEPTRAGQASIRFLTSPAAGTLRAVRGVAAARRIDTVREVRVTPREGALLQPAVDTYGRLGHVLAAGEDPAPVAAAAEQALARIHLEIEFQPTETSDAKESKEP